MLARPHGSMHRSAGVNAVVGSPTEARGMTKFASSKFSVGSNSAEAKKNFDSNYDRIFGKKQDDKAYLHVISDHEIDEIVAKAKANPLKSLTPSEYQKLPTLSEAEIQTALDKGRDEAFPRRRGR